MSRCGCGLRMQSRRDGAWRRRSPRSCVASTVARARRTRRERASPVRLRPGVSAKSSPSRVRFRPPSPLTFGFRLVPSETASTYSRPVLGAGGNLGPRAPERKRSGTAMFGKCGRISFHGSSMELAEEPAAADQPLGVSTYRLPQGAVRGHEPGVRKARRFADQPVVCALGGGADEGHPLVELLLVADPARSLAVEDEDDAVPMPLGPGPGALDELLLREVRPLRAEHVPGVDQDDRQVSQAGTAVASSARRRVSTYRLSALGPLSAAST